MRAGITERDETACIRLRLLEGFELTVDGVAAKTTPSLRRVMAYLALQNRPVRRCSLAGALWPDTDEDRARANLRSTLCRIASPCDLVIDLRNDHVALATDVVIDLHEALATAKVLLSENSLPDEDIDARLFRGELLPELGDPWLTVEREHARQTFLHALEALAERLIDAQRLPYAIMAALAAIRKDPLRESATRLLVQAHLSEGNPSEAVRAFATYRDILRTELDLEPSADLVNLMAGSLPNPSTNGVSPT